MNQEYFQLNLVPCLPLAISQINLMKTTRARLSQSFSLLKSWYLLTAALFCSNAVLSFAIESLKVKHVIVMGHYGCGGVAASMVHLPSLYPQSAVPAFKNWILPIRQIYESSKRFGNPSSVSCL